MIAWAGVLSFVLAVIFTYFVRQLALRWSILDTPNSPRKIHKLPTPLLGGLSIFIAFTIVVVWLHQGYASVLFKDISSTAILGVSLGGLILMIGGYLDDRYNLEPKRQILWPIAAALLPIISGISVGSVTNPNGGMFQLIPALGAIVTFVWLLGMMYTTKLLDGLDGLVTGLGVIGSVVIFFLTQFTRFYQPSVGMLAIVFAGACLGFLMWNFHPAKIFLGEGGSLFIGYILGVLAIISGAKIATTLLIVGIPVLDVIWAVIRRIWQGRSIVSSDRAHLHHKLLDAGLNQTQAVLFLYVLALGFGVVALFLNTAGKLLALLVVILTMIILTSKIWSKILRVR